MQTHRQENLMRRSPQRRGYALVLVVVFSVLFFTLVGVAWRQMSSVVRIFTVRTNQLLRDRGATQALADGLHALDVGQPPGDPDVYQCCDTVQIPPLTGLKFQSGQASSPYYYTLTFTRARGQEAGGNRVYQMSVEQSAAAGTPLFKLSDFVGSQP
jgi:Tfp pilus assembly protein PilX